MADPVNTDTLRAEIDRLRDQNAKIQARLDASWQREDESGAARLRLHAELNRLTDGIRQLHTGPMAYSGECAECGNEWPCATRKLVDSDG